MRPAFLGRSPALQRRILDPLMNQFLSCCSFLPSVCTKADKHRPSEEAGWVIRNFWLGVTGKSFNVLNKSVCRSFPSEQEQRWQSRDAFLLQVHVAWGWRGASLCRQSFRVKVKMLCGTCLSHCSSVSDSVFRLFGDSDRRWLFSCFAVV